jgi:hypothetical protein
LATTWSNWRGYQSLYRRLIFALAYAIAHKVDVVLSADDTACMVALQYIIQIQGRAQEPGLLRLWELNRGFQRATAVVETLYERQQDFHVIECSDSIHSDEASRDAIAGILRSQRIVRTLPQHDTDVFEVDPNLPSISSTPLLQPFVNVFGLGREAVTVNREEVMRKHHAIIPQLRDWTNIKNDKQLAHDIVTTVTREEVRVLPVDVKRNLRDWVQSSARGLYSLLSGINLSADETVFQGERRRKRLPSRYVTSTQEGQGNTG